MLNEIIRHLAHLFIGYFCVCVCCREEWGNIYSVSGPRLVVGSTILSETWPLLSVCSQLKEEKGREPGSIGAGVVLSEWQLSLHHTMRYLTYHKIMD